MLRTHRTGKGPGGCGGWGLGSTEQKGPRCAPYAWSQRAGDFTWEPSRLPGLSGWGKCPPLLSCSSSPGGPLPPASPDLPSLPPMPPGPMRPGLVGSLEGRGSAWELSRVTVPKWTGQSPSAPLLLLLEGPSCLPLLISPASGAPILSGLHFLFPPQSPHVLPVGSSTCLLGRQGPPPVAGGCPSCGETLTRSLPTLPS